MLNELFFLNITPEELIDKTWNKLNDPSEYYSTASDSAEWAMFIFNIFPDVKFYILKNIDEDYDFFAYVMVENTPYDVSGFHATHQAIIDDNEFYGYGINRREASIDEIKIMMGEQSIDFLMNTLIIEQ